MTCPCFYYAVGSYCNVYSCFKQYVVPHLAPAALIYLCHQKARQGDESIALSLYNLWTASYDESHLMTPSLESDLNM